MFCTKCGAELAPGDSFCGKCGSKVGQASNLIKMRCDDCGGTMEVDKELDIMSCPYCNSKKIFLDSDDVKIEKVKANKEIELEKIANKQMNTMDNKMLTVIGLMIAFLVFFILIITFT